MSTVSRDELHELLERVRPEELDKAAQALAPLAEEPPPRRRMPKSLGMRRGRPDASSRVDEILRENGFGQ
ncbi:hypothetical protein [Nesterenkonia alba]|uniref:hypothetical protein n=1 Tax=Nesterenkonia alba TaxID=515814 RepID=UPI0012EB225C|nr:hypothetical protein [Nesterenkonia alba]